MKTLKYLFFCLLFVGIGATVTSCGSSRVCKTQKMKKKWSKKPYWNAKKQKFTARPWRR